MYTVPRGAVEEVRAEALSGLETMTTERRAVIEEGGAFELLETTVKDGGTWDSLFRALGGEMKKAILGMTDLNEPSRIGAYAAVEVRRGTTVDARIAMDERALSTTWSQQLLEPLMRFNAHLFPGGVVPPTPRLRWAIASKQVEVPLERLTEVLGLIRAGTLAPEAAVLALKMAFPSLPEADARAMVEAQGRLPSGPALPDADPKPQVLG